MTPTKLLIGQMLVALGIVVAGAWLATEWVAAQLGFQIRLGPPWCVILNLPVYLPWRFAQWWYVYDSYAPDIFACGGEIVASSGLLAAVAAVFGSLWRARQARIVTTYGSARWASQRETDRAGLLAPDGVFLGTFGGRYLRHDGPEHVMAFAPTRSGKGVGLVIPTLLTHTESAVIHDIKGELWQLTAGFRSRFSHALLFNPTDPRSAAHNPLLEVRRGVKEVRDTQNIADVLVDPEGMLERRNHWEKTSHSLLVASILHVLYAEADKTLMGVAALLSDPSQPFEITLRRMMLTPHLGDRPHPVVASGARELLNKSDNERSGVLSTAMSFLGLYRDPIVAAVTGRCDWRIADLVVPPSDISRTKPLIRLILNQIGRRLTESLEGETGSGAVGEGGTRQGSPRRRLLMMLDEFPTLGRLDFFEAALAFMAGYRLRAVLIAQSLNQIEKAYGPNNSILDNCHVRVAFSTNDERTAKRISDALGTATELRAQRNYAGHRLSPWLGHLMVSRQETARPLLTPGEVMQFPPEEEIVMVSGHPPVRAKKLRYFEDDNFTARVLPPPSLPPPSPSRSVYPDRPEGRVDDWTGLRLPALHPTSSHQPGVSLHTGDGGGISQEAALGAPFHGPEGESKQRAPEFERASEFDDDADDMEVGDERSPRQLTGQFSRTARLAALDPDDGLHL